MQELEFVGIFFSSVFEMNQKLQIVVNMSMIELDFTKTDSTYKFQYIIWFKKYEKCIGPWKLLFKIFFCFS